MLLVPVWLLRLFAEEETLASLRLAHYVGGLLMGPWCFVRPCERIPERSRQSVPAGFRGVSLGGQHGHPGDKYLPLSVLRRCSQRGVYKAPVATLTP